jgi:hypothetical protein
MRDFYAGKVLLSGRKAGERTFCSMNPDISEALNQGFRTIIQ